MNHGRSELVGLNELVRELNARIGPDVIVRVARRGAKRGGEQISHAAEREAPKDEGLLAESMGVVVRAYQSGNVVAIIGPINSPRFKNRPKIAHIVERDHRVAVGGTLTRLSGKNAGKAPRSKVGKTGKGTSAGIVKGNPFLERAFDSSKAIAISAISDEIRQHIEQGKKAGP